VGVAFVVVAGCPMQQCVVVRRGCPAAASGGDGTAGV
jgi:hypothetical protein